MKKVTVRDLRYNFQKVECLLEEGEELEITKRGRPIAHVVPCRQQVEKKIKLPDFAARRNALFGNKVLDRNIILEERNSYQW